MKYSIFFGLFLACAGGAFAQETDSISDLNKPQPTDFSNPAGIFTQATFSGSITTSMFGPGGGNRLNFNDAYWTQLVSTEVAIGNVGIGTSFGFSNLEYMVLSRPTAHISYRQPIKYGMLQAAKLTLGGGIPIIDDDTHMEQPLPYFTHTSLHFMVEAMADIQLSKKWRVAPYFSFNQYKTPQSRTTYIIIDSSGNIYSDTTKFKPLAKMSEYAIGAHFTNAYSNTHFLQLQMAVIFRDFANLSEITAVNFNPQFNGRFFAGLTYQTSLWKTLMLRSSVSFTSVNKFTNDQKEYNLGWQGQIMVGLRYGL